MASGYGPMSQICVMHMIDPSTFWFVSVGEEHLRESMEESFTALMNQLTTFANTAKPSMYTAGQRVVIKNPDTYMWQRGEVQCEFNNTCKVLLLDHGIAKHVNTSTMRPMPMDKEFLKPSYASKIQLRGVSPVKTVVFAERPPQVLEATEWAPAAYTFISSQLARAESAHLLTHEDTYEVANDLFLGQVLLLIDGQLVHLAEQLVSKQYAMESGQCNERAKAYQLDPGSVLLGPNVTSPLQVCSPMLAASACFDEGGGDACIGVGISRKKRLDVLSPVRPLEQSGGDAPRARAVEETTYMCCPAGGNLQLFNEAIRAPKASAGRVSRKETSPVTSPNALCGPQKDKMKSGDVTPAGPEMVSPRQALTSDQRKVVSPASDTVALDPLSRRSLVNQQRINKIKAGSEMKTESDVVASNPPAVSPPFDNPHTVSPHTDLLSPLANVISPRSGQVSPSVELDALSTRSLLLQKRLSLSNTSASKTEPVGGVTSPRSQVVSPSSVPEAEKPEQSVLAKRTELLQKKLSLKKAESDRATETVPMRGEAASPKPGVGSPVNAANAKPASSPNPRHTSTQAALPVVPRPTVTYAGGNNSAMLPVVPRRSAPYAGDRSIVDIKDKIRVLVHGEPLKQMKHISEAMFPEAMDRGLDKLRVGMRPLCSYTWPGILRGDSVLIVSPKAGGKTMGYLVPLLSQLLEKSNYKQFVKKSNGPYAVILCSGSRSCELVHAMCSTLLGGDRSLKVLFTHGGGAELEKKVALTNGCDVLISTPRCFLRLLAYSKYLVNLHRLCHLVLDEANLLQDKFLPEVRSVLASCRAAVEHRLSRGVVHNRLQVVTASERWSDQLYAMVHAATPEPLVVIGAYLEAAIYARVRPHLQILDKTKKPGVVLDILSNTKGLYKTVIVCGEKSEAEALFQFLEERMTDIQILLLHEEIFIAKIEDVKCQWALGVEGDYPVLVCTDATVLQDLTISDARVLVHYNLPQKKNPFGDRFTMLMDSYPDIHSTTDARRTDCMVYILADDDNMVQLPGIVDFMRRLGASILQVVEDATEDQVREKEWVKEKELCYNLKAFGDCWDSKTCPNRHAVIEADRPVDIPTRGRVKLKIVTVLDTCCFSARLLEVTDCDGEVEQVEDDYVSMGMELALLRAGAKGELRAHGTVREGDVCALEVTPGLLERVKVETVTEKDNNGQPKELTVLMMDNGLKKHRVNPASLTALPERLQEVPAQVYTVLLCNVVPVDLDITYSHLSYNKMCRWIEDADANEADGMYIVGDIRLSLGRTLWLDPLHIKQSLRSVEADVVGVALRRQLIRDHVAVENPTHLNTLYCMCRKAGIMDFPEHVVPEPPSAAPASLPEPRWAHLPADCKSAVVMSSADSPDVVFVRRHELQASLTRLTNDIQKHVAARGKHATSYGGEGLVIAEGALCLGKSEQDNLWHRAKVLGVGDDGLVELFFVDYGDRGNVSAATHVTPIEASFITRLPFQAIECSLFGLEPNADGSGWCDTAVDLLYDKTVYLSNGTARMLDYEIYTTDTVAKCTGGRKYAVALIDPNAGDGNDAVINRVILSEHMARPVEDEAGCLEDLPRFVPPRVKTPEEREQEPEQEPEHFVRLADLKGKRAEAVNETDDLKMADDEKCFDFEIEDVQAFIFNMLKGKSKDAALQLEALNAVAALPALCEAPATPSVPSANNSTSTPPQKTLKVESPQMVASVEGHPRIVWHQTLEEVVLSVEMVDVQHYSVQTGTMELDLSATVDGITRDTHLNLFGSVDPRYTTHYNTGRKVHITMAKFYTNTWPHLLQHPDKCYYWLRYNIDHTMDLDREQVCGSGEEEFDPELFDERAKAAMASTAGVTLRTSHKDDIQPDFQYNESSSESDNSEFAEEDRPYEFHDIHDPLS